MIFSNARKALGPTTLILLALGCTSEPAGNTDTVSESSTSEAAASKADQKCNLMGFSFQLGERERSFSLQYDGDKVVAAEMREKGTMASQRLKYEYDREGRLTACLLDTLGRVDYIYDDQGLLARTDGSGSANTRAFVYDEQDRMISQTTFFGGNPYMTLKFTYDNDGRLNTASLLDKNNEPMETKTLEYDDKKNPFVNMGPWVNSTDLLLGHAVGNSPNNIVRINTRYDKKTSYKVNGREREAGETSVQERSFLYNAQGYPESITLSRGGQPKL